MAFAGGLDLRLSLSTDRTPRSQEEFDQWAYPAEKGLLNGHIDWGILYYYNTSWQVLEEHDDSTAWRQYVWDIRFKWAAWGWIGTVHRYNDEAAALKELLDVVQMGGQAPDDDAVPRALQQHRQPNRTPRLRDAGS